ncbi:MULTISPECIES: DUF349 domain-containing protein [unclassified Polaribacter]|uniref:DUF349 domain-containing protein n=1 Tax=unclassified Polaribacter TaxID=196858 RepID=UPI0011BE3034|nr:MULTISPECIES: DUF349 domain-containing protein [unclassified Polaribacter]TXD54466.1 DUF349 domain-containing protein [Polaribacter sp. IC063]TXD60379.1 DUF349 domain-containing protein [Polaribacter sp. IC066]
MLDKNEENVEKNELKSTEKVDVTPNENELVENIKTENVEVVSKEEEKTTSKNEEIVDETSKAVIEVKDSLVEKEEKEIAKEKDESATVYSKLTLEALVLSLKEIIADNPAQKIKTQVETVKTAFNQKFGALIAEKKAAFLADGGNVIDFQFSSPIKAEYNSLLADYKKQRDAHYNDLDKQLNDNLEKRVAVIESLKSLIDEADATTMYKNFKEIQDTWRTIGAVPKVYYNDTWKIYHHHVERFYDLLHLSNDFRDLEFKHNLEEKLNIIKQAEALAKEPDVNYASKELQELHKIWKEDIGPVAKELREEIWHKFSLATKTIHDKRHEYFKEMRSKYQDITNKKLEIIALVDAYDTSKNKSHNDWQKSINDIETLRQQYFNVGKLPYSKSEEVWQKFKGATKKFNSSKNTFYKEEKSSQQDNLEKKIALIELAESLRESEDWEKATNTLKKVQADWKKIGHVPRKFSDDIWKRFKAACNHYFDRFHEQKNSASKEEQAVAIAKKEFLEVLKEAKETTKETVLESIKAWRSLGKLPSNARHLEGKFNKQIDRMLESLSLDKNEISMLKFTNVVDGYAAEKDTRRLDSEQIYVRKKIDEIMKEMQQLENNLGFFSNAKADNPLVVNVRNKVNDFKEDLLTWKEKLQYLKKLDY